MEGKGFYRNNNDVGTSSKILQLCLNYVEVYLITRNMACYEVRKYVTVFIIHVNFLHIEL